MGTFGLQPAEDTHVRIGSWARLGNIFPFGLQPAERTQIRIRIAGLRRPQAAARTTSCKVDFACSKPAAERMGLRSGEAALRPGRLWVAAASYEAANSAFNIQDSKLDGLPGMLGHTFLLGQQPAGNRTKRTCRTRVAGLCRAEAAARTTSCEVDFACSKPAAKRTGVQRAARDCSPPPGGGCGLPVAVRPICRQTRPSQQAAAGRCALSGANSKFNQNKIGSWARLRNISPFGAQPAERTQIRIRVAGLRRREAAARCGFCEAANSRFKIRRVSYWFGSQLAKRTRERTCGREKRAFAGAKLRPAAVPYRNRKFKIQDSKSTAARRCLKTSIPSAVRLPPRLSAALPFEQLQCAALLLQRTFERSNARPFILPDVAPLLPDQLLHRFEVGIRGDFAAAALLKQRVLGLQALQGGHGFGKPLFQLPNLRAEPLFDFVFQGLGYRYKD